MTRSDRSGERLVALFLLGLLLLLPPVLLIFNRPERALGIPVLYLYIFAAWLGLIALSAIVSERIGSELSEPAGPPDAAPETGRVQLAPRAEVPRA